MNLTGSQIKDTYEGVLNIGATGLTGTFQEITDGLGNLLNIQVSDTTINFSGIVTGNIIGTTGAAGTSGTSGTSGINGTSGTSGTSGVSGSSGTSGTSGINGATGPAGPTGADGSSGVAGSTGATGPAGATGAGASSPITLEQTNSLVSTAIGATAGAGSNCAVVIGNNACTLPGIGSLSVVIGSGAKHCDYGSESVIVGPGAYATNIGIVSIGNNACGNSQNGVNIGPFSGTVCNISQSSIAIGKYTIAYGFYDPAICAESFADLAIGNVAISRFGGIALGDQTFSCANRGIGIGGGTKVFPGATGTIVLGNSSVGGTGACNSVVLGNSTTVAAANQIAIGSDINKTNPNPGQNKIAIGFGLDQSAAFTSNKTIEIGCHVAGAAPLDGTGIIIGFDNSPQYGAGSITLGSSNSRHSGGSITIGNCNGSWDNSIMVGMSNCANPGNGGQIMVGFSNTVANVSQTIFGRGNYAIAANGIIIGNCNIDNGGGGGNGTQIFGQSNVHCSVGIFHGSTLGYQNTLCNIPWQSCDHTTLGESNTKIGDGTAYCHSLVVGSLNCVPGNPGNCTSIVGHYNNLCSGATGSVILGSCSVASAGIQNAVVIGNNLTSVKANAVHVNSIVAFGQGASLTQANGNVGGTVTLDWDNGNNQSLTLTSSISSLTLSNPIDGANYGLFITQGGVGNYTITWPASVKWPNATPPVITGAIGSVTTVSLIYIGTVYYGSFATNLA